MPSINWPNKFSKANTKVHVHNEIYIGAKPEVVWACLIDAESWPRWYSNSSRVSIKDGVHKLGPGTRFGWKTFGVNLKSQVMEFVPCKRLAWNAKAIGIE